MLIQFKSPTAGDCLNIDEICDNIKSLSFVSDVQKKGSRFEGRSDIYSDYDLTVVIKDIRPDDALLRITELLKAEYSSLWFDYANSLMPHKFLVSMFINCENPFSFVDIGIYADGDINYDPKNFENDRWVHLTKLWIMNFKYYLRGDDRFSESFKKMLRKADIGNSKNDLDGFGKLLELLSSKETVSKAYIDKLYDIYGRAEKHGL